MICNPVDFLDIYFLDPLVAGCYQDDDPTYKTSDFNNFNRVDGFDSDLWNNDERFDITRMNMNVELNIPKALQEAREKNLEIIQPQIPSSRFYVLESQKLEWNTLYESAWLYEMLGKPKIIDLQLLNGTENMKDKNPIFIVMKAHIEEYTKLFRSYEEKNINFYVIHLSDEHSLDDISFYDLSCCKGVVRNYFRNNLSNKVLVLPLGYHYTINSGIESPYERTPQLPFRRNIWSFHGTNWCNRKDILDPLQVLGDHTYKLYDNWNDANSLKQKEYCSMLLDSIFIPCVGGQNAETFRFYESLECGCIPILVNDASSEYFGFISNYIPLLNLPNWQVVPDVIQQMLNDKEALEKYRFIVLNAYKDMKQNLKQKIKEILMV